MRSVWANQIGGLLGAAAFLIPGVIILLRPEIGIRWAKAGNPGLDEKSPFLRHLGRFIALIFIAIGVVNLIGVLR